ncbi:MAG: tRNA (guanosine(37)-N1)-methyltransferase TrmD [Eubacteriales bacterium]
MRFDIMTLFPELVSGVLGESIIGRAQKSGLVSVHAHNIRDFANNKHRKVDDTPYGGGFGMLMMAPPVFDCCEFVKNQVREELGENIRSKVIYMSPQGRVLTQAKAQELSEYDNLIILCGHYEGIDARVLEEIVDEEISIGDYVLTGGELPACVLVDCISRLREGVLSDKKCYEEESISCGKLEFPQYTRPYEFHGKKVPDVLISGNHAEIDKWRTEQSLKVTGEKRPDLLENNK